MKKLILGLTLLLSLTGAGGGTQGSLDDHELRLLTLHLGYTHPVSGVILSRPTAGEMATAGVTR